MQPPLDVSWYYPCSRCTLWFSHRGCISSMARVKRRSQARRGSLLHSTSYNTREPRRGRKPPSDEIFLRFPSKILLIWQLAFLGSAPRASRVTSNERRHDQDVRIGAHARRATHRYRPTPRARVPAFAGRARSGAVPVGRATSLSADTDILVVPALVRSDAGSTWSAAKKASCQISKILEGNSRKISSLSGLRPRRGSPGLIDVDTIL